MWCCIKAKGIWTPKQSSTYGKILLSVFLQKILQYHNCFELLFISWESFPLLPIPLICQVSWMGLRSGPCEGPIYFTPDLDLCIKVTGQVIFTSHDGLVNLYTNPIGQTVKKTPKKTPQFQAVYVSEFLSHQAYECPLLMVVLLEKWHRLLI